MEDIIELLFTVVAVFFWLFGGAFLKKRQERESSSRRKKERKVDQSPSDEELRQREIRESIRRKILERRQQGDSEPVIIQEPTPQYQAQYTEPEREIVVEEPAYYSEPAVEEDPVETPFSWSTEENGYEQKMQERLKRIEETKRQAEALKNKVNQTANGYSTSDRARSEKKEPVLSIGSVQTALKNRENVQAAFVYGEILGKPVGLRRSSEVGLEI